MIIDLETMKRLEEDVKENIELYIILQKERLYKEFAQNNLFTKREILFNSIAYAKIKENANSTQEIYDNYLKENNNDINISSDVPDSFIEEFLEYINIVLEKNKEDFYIDPLQIGRYDLLLKGVIHYIKLLNSYLQNQKITFPHEISQFLKTTSLKDTVELYFNKMIDNAITFCKCYEADSTDNKMCKEALNKSFTEHYKYQYKLDKSTTKKLQEDIKLIITNLENKTEYTKHIDFKESVIHLSDTLYFAKKSIDDMIENNQYLQSKDYASVIKIYKQIFINSQKRFQSSKKTSAFLTELKKSNMYHRMTYKDKVIYPFLYDFIVMGFVFSVFHLKNKEIYTNSNLVAKVFNDTKYKYLEKSSDDNYHFNEFIRVAEEIPQEYKVLDEPMIIIIKHYSEFLNCKYNNIANILKQLRFESAEHNSSVYNLLQDQRNIQLGLEYDYFRKLSLYIM